MYQISLQPWGDQEKWKTQNIKRVSSIVGQDPPGPLNAQHESIAVEDPPSYQSRGNYPWSNNNRYVTLEGNEEAMEESHENMIVER